jgi:hypothetical protein
MLSRHDSGGTLVNLGVYPRVWIKDKAKCHKNGVGLEYFSTSFLFDTFFMPRIAF